MTRTARLIAALLLAGLALVLLPDVAWAENRPWKFKKGTSPITDQFFGAVISHQQFGGLIGFTCARYEPSSRFVALVSVVDDNVYDLGNHMVSWRFDNGPEIESVWQPNPNLNMRTLGLVLVGTEAYELALKVSQAKEQIEIETPRGIIVNDLDYAAKTIGRLLRHCRLQ